MPRARLELARLTAQASKTCVATNYTISAAQFSTNFEFNESNDECLADRKTPVVV